MPRLNLDLIRACSSIFVAGADISSTAEVPTAGAAAVAVDRHLNLSVVHDGSFVSALDCVDVVKIKCFAAACDERYSSVEREVVAGLMLLPAFAGRPLLQVCKHAKQ